MATSKTYSISTDFPNAAVDPSTFETEIQSSTVTVALDYVATDGDDCTPHFKADLDATDEATLDAVVVVHQGEPPAADPLSVSIDGVPTVIADVSEESRLTLYTPNLCDKCTWYQQSVESVEEVLTPDGAYETYSAVHQFWIDLYHGRVSDEDDLVADYSITVAVNDVEKTMDTPFGADSDGDYSVDPANGQITFHTPLTGTDIVKATYHYAAGSEWIMAPSEGKDLQLLGAECQLSRNVAINDTIQYSIWILGQYVGGPLGVPVKIKEKKYKTAADFINESNGAYPEVPAFGNGSRGLSQPVLIFPWLYKTKTVLHSEYGMEIRVSLAADQVCGGELAVVTFYCVSVGD